jgi:CubicO group peptidase (beta-lactamase class C family)
MLFNSFFPPQDITGFAAPDSIMLEAFMDGMIQSKMNDKNIAGAAVSIIHDGRFLLKKGYGYADLANRVPVSPDSTIFRIGSISKLFTWMAVMQYVEQGEIDLDADINTYLEAFQIHESYSDPVTMRSIMSHTAGFEDKLIHLFVKDPADMKPLDQILREQMPKRVRPPLKHASYSNHGTGLASYIIELLSNQSFEEYVEEQFFTPLQMNYSTFRQPLPDKLYDQLSKGYAMESGQLTEKYFEFIPLAGAGGASSTALDMAHLMMALMDGSCFEEQCIMEAETLEKMKTPVLYHAEDVNPALHGFMDISMNGIRILGHSGDTFWFHSLLAIFPEHDLGLFLTFNSEGGGGTYFDILEQFTNRFFPDTRPLFTPVELEEGYLERFTGQYKFNRHSHNDISKMISIFSLTTVSINGGKLRLDMPAMFGEPATHWIPIDSTRFRSENSNKIIAFEQRDDGRIEHMYFGGLAILALDKLDGFWSPSLHTGISLLTILISLFMLVIWPFIYLARRNYEFKDNDPSHLPLMAKLSGFATSLCLILFYTLFAIGMSAGQEVIIDIPAAIQFGLIFPLLAIVFLLGMIWQSWQLWKLKRSVFINRFFYSLGTLIFIAAIWQLHFWNLLGWQY